MMALLVEVATVAGDELERRALAGDASAWDALVRRHDRRVVVSLLARGQPLERARELAQEAWIRLIEQQRRGALSELRLPALAVAQATYLALTEARRGAGGAGDPAEVASGVPDPAPSPEQALLSCEQVARAEAALSALGPRAQQIFRLAYREPFPPHGEVARAMGISVQRVRQTLCEVRRHLRASLEDEP